MEEDRDLDPLIDPGRLLRAATRRAEVRTAARVDARLLAAPRDADAESDGGAGWREAPRGAEGCGRGERRGGHRECVRRGGVGTPRTMGGDTDCSRVIQSANGEDPEIDPRLWAGSGTLSWQVNGAVNES